MIYLILDSSDFLSEETTQIRRLVARDGLSVEAARARLAAQMSNAERIVRADHVIDNNGGADENASVK